MNLNCIGDYAMGLEPANRHPFGQANIAKAVLLRYVEPGQVIESVIRLTVSA